MHRKDKLFAKIVSVILLIILLFAVIILISYETQCRNQALIDTSNYTEISINSTKIPNSNTITPEEEPIVNSEPNNQSQNNPELDEIEVEIEPNTYNIENYLIVSIQGYPPETDEILVMVSPKDSEDPVEDENSLINFINPPFDEEFAIDTNNVPNGEYILTIASTYSNAPENDPWTSIYRKNLSISN